MGVLPALGYRSPQNFDFYACQAKNNVKTQCKWRESYTDVANAFLTRLELIWPISSLKLSERLAQFGERRSAEREVVSSNPDRTNTQGLKIN